MHFIIIYWLGLSKRWMEGGELKFQTTTHAQKTVTLVFGETSSLYEYFLFFFFYWTTTKSSKTVYFVNILVCSRLSAVIKEIMVYKENHINDLVNAPARSKTEYESSLVGFFFFFIGTSFVVRWWWEEETTHCSKTNTYLAPLWNLKFLCANIVNVFVVNNLVK